MGESTVWEFFAWLNLGLFATAFSWWTVGDLTQIYWLPMLNKTEWMMNPRWMMRYWLFVYSIASVAAWIVWRDAGGWTESSGPLTAYTLTIFFAITWHWMLFMKHQIQFSFYLAVVFTGLSMLTTVWFFLTDTVSGILLLITTLWVLYVTSWNFMLVRCNTTERGKVRKYSDRLTFQQVGAGLPQPDMWHAAGRACPYQKPHDKFMRSQGRI